MPSIFSPGAHRARVNTAPPTWRWRVPRILHVFWRGLREWCGDSAYERYLRAPATKCAAGAKLTPAEFYVEQLNRRYSRPNRCC
jgi:uncharacterized short protein YbdD (DUF466 family)